MGSLTKKNVLIIGASGIVGKSAVEEFVKNGEWNVYGISRTYPSILSAEHSAAFQHTPLDLFDQKACAEVLPRFNFVTHILYCALIEQPGDLTESWLSVKNGDDNVQMMKNCMSILLKECKSLEHVQWLQGTKAYGVHYRSVLVPLREHENIDPNPDNWYWKQEAYMLEQLKGTNIRWSIFRPCCIWGDSLGRPMTPTKTLPLYAILCKYLNRPLLYPIVSDISYVNHVDGRMMGRAFIWACTSQNAHGQSFNLDNGDVWEFRSMWHVLSRHYNVPLTDKDESFTLVQFFKDHEHTWKAIVEKFGLREFTLEDLAGQSVQNVDIQMNNCEEQSKLGGGKVWIESRVKLTQAGFTDCVDTEEMALHYFNQMARDKLLPTREQLEGGEVL